MKIVFINLSLRPNAKRKQLPVGLGYVMTAVKKAGFDFDLIDMDINNLSIHDLQVILSRKTYDIYAFGCMVTGFKIVRDVAMVVKETNPNSIVIAGNSVVTSIPEILLQNTKVDIGVMGEGDIAIVELLQSLECKKAISDIKGIVFKGNDKIIHTPARPTVSTLDVLGFPDWNIFDLEKYGRYGNINYRYINTESFFTDKIIPYPHNIYRGCPYRCTFCHRPVNDKFRRYSVKAVIEEIKRLHYEYNCNYVYFYDELTFPNIKGIEAIVNGLEKLDFKIGWEAVTRGNLFKKEHLGLVKAMKSSGCENLAFSLENASPEILAAMNKKMNVSDFIEQVRVLWEGGVVPFTSVVFGYPQETPETIQQTIKVCEECNLYPSVGFLLLLPGSPIYEWAKKKRYIVDEVEYLTNIRDRQDFNINLTGMTDEEFIDTVTSELEALAKKLGLKLESVFKTGSYQRPET